MSKKRSVLRKHRSYSDALRNQVVQSIVEGGLSVKEACMRFKIKSEGSVYNWVHAYESSPFEFIGQIGELGSMEQEVKGEKREEELDLETLKEQLKKERLRSESYLHMIESAEERYNISILKKGGAKRSKK